MTDSCYVNDKALENLVVENTSISFTKPLSFSVSTNYDTLDINNSFYVCKTDFSADFGDQKVTGIYTVMESKDITDSLVKQNKISICSSGIVNKIVLVDFPIGQYTLSLNGFNVATAKLNTGGQYEFDFQDRKKSQILEMMIEVAKGLEPEIPNRQNYLNLGRIDQINIHKSKDCTLSKKHTIQLYGYFLVDDQWINTVKEIAIYPHDTYHLLSNHVIESFDLTIEGNGNVSLLIDGDSYLSFQTQTGKYRIRVHNPHKLFHGRQNKYLSDEINQNVINMATFDHLHFIVDGCQIVQMRQNYYQTYFYPQRIPLFDL